MVIGCRGGEGRLQEWQSLGGRRKSAPPRLVQGVAGGQKRSLFSAPRSSDPLRHVENAESLCGGRFQFFDVRRKLLQRRPTTQVKARHFKSALRWATAGIDHN